MAKSYGDHESENIAVRRMGKGRGGRKGRKGKRMRRDRRQR